MGGRGNIATRLPCCPRTSSIWQNNQVLSLMKFVEDLAIPPELKQTTTCDVNMWLCGSLN